MTKSFNRKVAMLTVCGGLLFVTYIMWQNNPSLHRHRHIHTVTSNHLHQQKHVPSQPHKHTSTPVHTEEQLHKQNNGICTPKRRVAFLKVHKAASSTFANILKRFGYFRNSTFVIPVNGSSHFAQFGTLTRDLFETVPADMTPDIFFHHVVYNRDSFKQLLPRDMVYVASVREPVSWFISAFLYYRYDKRVARVINDNTRSTDFYIREYFKSPTTFEYGLPLLRALYRLPYDFGIPVGKFTDVDFINRYVFDLDDDFKIVLIAEFFDESLILFRRYMCWHIRDMFYLPRQVSHRNKPHSLPTDLLAQHRRLAPASYILYQHFLARFKKEVELQGPDFYAEVTVFKDMLKAVNQFCLSAPRNESSITLSSHQSGEFQISGLDCFVMNYTRPMRILAEDSKRATMVDGR